MKGRNYGFQYTHNGEVCYTSVFAVAKRRADKGTEVLSVKLNTKDNA